MAGRKRKEGIVQADNFEAKEDELIKDLDSTELKNKRTKQAKARKQQHDRVKELRDKFKAKNPEIMVMNNTTNCTYIYIDPKTNVKYEFNQYGQTDYMNFEDIQTLVRQKRSHLEKYWMLILDIQDDELTLQDLIEVLSLEDIYTSEDLMYSDNIDYILFDSNFEEFENTINSVNENYLKMILNRAVGLYNAKKFTDAVRLRTLITKFGDEEDFLTTIGD